MSKSFLVGTSLVTAVLVAFGASTILAKGGGGGGGGHGGGGGGGGGRGGGGGMHSGGGGGGSMSRGGGGSSMRMGGGGGTHTVAPSLGHSSHAGSGGQFNLRSGGPPASFNRSNNLGAGYFGSAQHGKSGGQPSNWSGHYDKGNGQYGKSSGQHGDWRGNHDKWNGHQGNWNGHHDWDNYFGHGHWDGPGRHYWPWYIGSVGWGWGLGIGWDYPYMYNYYPGESSYYYGYSYVPSAAADSAVLGAGTAAPPPSSAGTGSEAVQYYSEARSAFLQGDYRSALRLAGHAAVEAPQNPKVHELTSLALFASGNHRAAASEAHAAMALGPIADWNSLYEHYNDVDKYTAHLRALEKAAKDNPKSAAERFLLGYHYLMTGARDQAKEHLAEALKLTPDDKLADYFVKQLESNSPITPPPL